MRVKRRLTGFNLMQLSSEGAFMVVLQNRSYINEASLSDSA